ncbi:39S ribosomal protein L16, mitochondrial [Galendromus occidentalis]|uniref:Large ribosomal subunit protein uL16m n=1 Tax=Galendromus occidentalis TaxID=34638 RepID=A0AAJ6QUU2_9ACAR|nr:39S ribosomal protein L16, mitochondrial [Galendromus occidentalis]
MTTALGSRAAFNSQISNVRYLKRWKVPERFENVNIEANERRLAMLERQPIYPPGVRPMKVPKELCHMKGPETVNNTLLYKQYGVMTLCGGWLRTGVIEMMRLTLNKKLDLTTSFAAWRIDPPYKPLTKKGIGKRMGKGKGAIDQYVVPVKAGRILFEVGGTIDFLEIEPVLQEICYKLSVDAIPVSQQILENIEAHYEKLERRNINPFSLKQVIDHNMHGSDKWVTKIEKKYYGDYI